MQYPNKRPCMRCGEDTVHINDRCLVCSDRQRKEEDERWAAMSVNEKLDWIRDTLRQIAFKL